MKHANGRYVIDGREITGFFPMLKNH